MKILIVTSEMPPVHSGFARLVTRNKTGLEKRGHQVDVISRKDMWCREYGEVRLTPFSFRQTLSPERLAQYDLVHLHGPAPTISDFVLMGFRLLPMRNRPKLIYSHHCNIDLPQFGPLSGMYNRLTHRLAKAADHVVTATPSYAAHVAKHMPRERVSVIPYGIDAEFYIDMPKEDEFNVLFVGQMRPYKGVDVLLETARLSPNVNFELVGRGYNLEMYQQQAHDKRVDNVTFHGMVEDEQLRGLYGKAHVITLPSLTTAEAFGIVQIEGMAAGCVPVSSQLPGVADVANLAGISVAPGNAQALSSGLRHFAEQREEWGHRSALARHIAAGFTWDKVVDAHIKIYDHVLNSGRSTQPSLSRAYQLRPNWAASHAAA